MACGLTGKRRNTMTETITRRQVRHPKDFGDRELFKRAFTHWIPSEKVDALYSELQRRF